MTPSQIEHRENHPATEGPSDFSIDHILNRAGTSSSSSNKTSDSIPSYSFETFSWLNCTRYCPPKIPRNPKKEGPQRRQLGRHPRIPFTSYQLTVLEEKFQQTPYLSSEEVIALSRKLQLADIRVKIWFQNRRARERREKPSTSSNSHTTTSLSNSTIVKESTSSNVDNSPNFCIYPPLIHGYYERFPSMSSSNSDCEN